MNPSDVRACVASLTDELIELASDLVRIESVTGNEDAAQRALAERLEAWGLAVDLFRIEPDIARHPAYCDDGLPPDRLDLVARWGEELGPGERAAVVLNGHMDVVPPGEGDEWDRAPFAGVVEDGALHGRGSCDMKGGLAALCLAIRAAMKLGVAPSRPVLLQSVVGEETGGLGTLATILRGYRADVAVIAEPTSLVLCPAQAGALSFRLHVDGRSAHGALREEGVSAIDKLWPVLEALRALETDRHRTFSHPLFGRDRLAAPLSVGTLRAGNWPSTVPEELIAEGRYGVFPGEECAPAREAFERAVAGACQRDAWLAEHPVRVEWFEGQFEPGETAVDSKELGELRRSHEAMLERTAELRGVSYGSDLRLFTRYAEMPAVLYGPGNIRLAHARNERLPLDELVHATEVYTHLIAGRLDA